MDINVFISLNFNTTVKLKNIRSKSQIVHLHALQPASGYLVKWNRAIGSKGNYVARDMIELTSGNNSSMVYFP
jgi:hypothetical protein